METLEELRTKNGWKKLMAKRIRLEHECAKEISEMIERGDGSDESITRKVAETYKKLEISSREEHKFCFGYHKQHIMKLAKSHNKIGGKHRSLYKSKQYGWIDIYTSRNLDALKEIRASMKRRADAYSETFDDVDSQIYRVNHNIENYQQVNLFDARSEAEAMEA
jgi:hypothetical protein